MPDFLLQVATVSATDYSCNGSRCLLRYRIGRAGRRLPLPPPSNAHRLRLRGVRAVSCVGSVCRVETVANLSRFILGCLTANIDMYPSDRNAVPKPLVSMQSRDLSSGMKVVLVTEWVGFIGSSLIEALLAQDKKVRVVDSVSTGKREN